MADLSLCLRDRFVIVNGNTETYQSLSSEYVLLRAVRTKDSELGYPPEWMVRHLRRNALDARYKCNVTHSSLALAQGRYGIHIVQSGSVMITASSLR